MKCVNEALASEEAVAKAKQSAGDGKGKKGGMTTKGEKLREACKEVAGEAELVTGLKPIILGRGRGKWRRGGGRGGKSALWSSTLTILCTFALLFFATVASADINPQPSAWDVYPPPMFLVCSQ